MAVIIGLSGKAQRGKTTASNLLAVSFGFNEVSFATPLKEGIKTMFGLTEEHVNGSLKEAQLEGMREGVTPRMLMQTLGTEWGRNIIDPDLWVKLSLQRAAKMGDDARIVFSDVRFENEARAIRDAGGFIIHIRRRKMDEADAKARKAKAWTMLKQLKPVSAYNALFPHKSEAGVKVREGDSVIDNDYALWMFREDLLSSIAEATANHPGKAYQRLSREVVKALNASLT
jgi:hypothetical protein